MSLLRAHKSVFEVVRDALAADSTLSHIKVSVGARFQGEQNPEVIIQQSSFDINDLNTADYGAFEISVFCYSNTYTEAAKIADTVFTAIQENDLYTLTEQELIVGSDPEQYNISQTLYHLKGLDLFLEHYDEDGYEANVLVRAIEAQDTNTGVGNYIPKTSGSPAPFYAQLDSRIQDLSDVNVSTLQEGEILKYDVSEGEWVNASLPILASSGINQSDVNGYTVLSLADSQSFTSASTSGDLTVGGDLYFAGAQTKLIRPINTGQAAGPLTIQSNGDLVIELDENADEPDKALIVKNGADTEVFKVDESGEVRVNNAYTLPSSDGLAGQSLITDGFGVLSFADISVDIQYHNRYASEAETLLDGATETVELYYTAQADGDGLHEDAQTDTATTGYDIRRKLYYAEKAQADPNTSADWTQFTAIADNTTFANAKAALLAYLKERTGGTVPISLKQTWEEVVPAPAFTGLLNETYGSGAAAAYSVRRLNGNYTGAAIQVERSSDNTYQDIGFDSNGDLDESALTTFCTGTTCKVRTWYDQSQTGGTGSGNDAVQTTHANQPTIYTGGAIVKEDGKPALDYTASTSILLRVASLSISQPSTVFTTGQGGTINRNFMDGVTATDRQTINTFNGYAYYAGTNNVQIASTLDTNQHLFYVLFNGANSEGGIDANTAVSGNAGNQSLTGLTIGNSRQDNASCDGTMQEFVLYESNNSANRTSIESNIGDYFTQNTPLLDTYSGAAAAYSLRKLSSTYSGSAIRVRRASDNAEADIGFNVFGELDTVSLAAHCGSNDGFVKVWYDQSGNSNDATQTTTSAQPLIYRGTTGVGLRNGKPFVNAYDKSLLTSLSNVSQPYTISAVFASQNAFARHMGNNLNLYQSASSVQFLNNEISNGGTFATGDQLNVFGVGNGSSSFGKVANATNQPSGVTFTSSTNFDLSVLFARYTPTSSNNRSFAHEFIIWGSDQSSNRTNIESNINTFYSIY